MTLRVHDRFSSFVSLLAINPANNSTIPISGVIGYGTVVNWNAVALFYPTTIGQETLYSIALFAWRQAMIRAFVILVIVTNCRQSETHFDSGLTVYHRAIISGSHVDDVASPF